ncbi:Transcriptional regulator [Kibdelosporangium sp. 4NS15]|uniref:Transcriptional regulator n=1 Tax=Kibdelosporangium persicum TaxID=2698649 RepID=A0ABX2F048_9PSEU|nr:Lrp/AsnC family transcriptional regulator [Kibdelosporangium persicum]NRN64688.1 Transcriptional regulator [Kibdelosporangium persicum]
MTLDEIDRHLLGLLQRDSTRTLHDLGADVGLSPSAVQRRIARYRSEGLITRQVEVLAQEKVGGMLAVVLVTIDRESVEHHTELRGRMMKNPNVQQCYAIAGEWDYLVVLACQNIAHCRDLVRGMFLADPNVKRFDTMPVFDAVKVGLELPV